MFQIAICDDNAEYLAYSKNVIKEYLIGLNIEHEIICFTEPTKLLQHLNSNVGRIDVVFQNIEFKNEESGIELAKQINEMDSNCKIVFLTAYLHYATDVYDTEHFYYILKEELKERIGVVFKKLHDLIEQERPKRLVLERKGKRILCLYDDIRMIERERRVSNVICRGKKIVVAKTLDEIYKELDTIRFVRCHNSYIVNLDYVSEWRRSAFMLEDEIQVPISRRYMDEVKEKFMFWIGK